MDKFLGDFGWAITSLQGGLKVSREGWHKEGMWLALQVPNEHSANRLPYIYIVVSTNEKGEQQRVPWVASHTDMLSADWFLVTV